FQGSLVPVQSGPFESAAVPFHTDSRNGFNQGAPETLLAKLRTDVQIFQPNTWTADEGREGKEIYRVAHHLAVMMGPQSTGHRIRSEQCAAQGFSCSLDLVFEPFESRQFTNEG